MFTVRVEDLACGCGCDCGYCYYYCCCRHEGGFKIGIMGLMYGSLVCWRCIDIDGVRAWKGNWVMKEKRCIDERISEEKYLKNR